MRSTSPDNQLHRSPTAESSSASDSLQGNLAKDAELSLNKAPRHSTWRDSMSGIARSMLLKAKDSIDTLRGLPEAESKGKLDLPSARPYRSSSLARDSRKTQRHVSEDDNAPTHRASLSLRRVLTSSSRHSKRSPLLVNLMAKRSTTKLQGPEEFTEDSSSSPGNSSPARASLQSLCKPDSPRSKGSKASSLQSSTRVPPHDRPWTTRDLPVRASSPIPIPNSSPPPTIFFEIESGKLSPHHLFELAEATSPDKLESETSPIVNAATANHVAIHRRRSKRQSIKDEGGKPSEKRVPKRSSNDHWHLRRTSRSKSSKIPESVPQHSAESDLTSFMPGTNMPLEDPFEVSESLNKKSGQEEKSFEHSKTGCHGGFDGAIDQTQVDTAKGHLQSPRAGHIDGTSGQWVSNDPAARLFAPLTPPSIPNLDFDALTGKITNGFQRATKDFATKQVLLEDDSEIVSPELLRSELKAERKTLERLEGRMAGIEAELRRNVSSDSTPTANKNCIRMTGHEVRFSPRQGSNQNETHGNTNGITSPAESDVESSQISLTSSKSPLEVQDMFYPSDNEIWDLHHVVRQSISEDADSAWSEAREHLHSMQKVASNGRVPSESVGTTAPKTPSNEALRTIKKASDNKSEITGAGCQFLDYLSDDTGMPSMGSPGEFLRKRTERAARYWDIFQDDAAHTSARAGAGHVGDEEREPSIINNHNSAALFPFTAEDPFGTKHISKAQYQALAAENGDLVDFNEISDHTPTRQTQLGVSLLKELGWPSQNSSKGPSRTSSPSVSRIVAPTTPTRVPFRPRQGPAHGPYQRTTSTEGTPLNARLGSARSTKMYEFDESQDENSLNPASCLLPIP